MLRSLWLGRDHAPKREHRSRRIERPRSRLREQVALEDDQAEVDIDELRRRRTAYYDVPSQQRRRSTPVASSSSIRNKPSSPTSSKPRKVSSISSRSRPSRGRDPVKKSSSRAGLSTTTPLRRRESTSHDFVYDDYNDYKPSRDRSIERVLHDDSERPNVRARSPRRSSTSRNSQSPIVLETEIVPDDSTSYVTHRSGRRHPVQGAFVRPSVKRRGITSPAKLSPASEVSGASTSKKTSTTSKETSATSRRHSTTDIPTAPTLVDCLTCGSDDIPSTQSALLECGHRMCQDCLKRIFELSVKDPVHMPPKCCTDEHIPLQHVEKLFDMKFKVLWNRKYQEFHSKNRVYCPAAKCGEWIKPSHYHKEQGRKFAVCPRCKTQVCLLCNNKLHKSRDCPKDPEIAKLVKKAKEEGWQRCYECRAMVEKQEGCNHMTCRCKAEFCILCGAKWKTCECPWFNQETARPGADQLNEMRIPEPAHVMFQLLRAVLDMPEDRDGEHPIPGRMREPVRGRGRGAPLQEETDDRRRQEQLDAEMARRLQMASIFENEEEHEPRRRRREDRRNIWEFGNAVENFLNDDFVQNAANVVMDAFGDTNLGRRGERASGRRRPARRASHNGIPSPGLVADFLGDESILGLSSAGRRR